MITAYLGLGGNIGDPVHSMALALRALDRDLCTSVVAVSSVYETPPWGPIVQPTFLNACASVETSLSADGLLSLCLAVETELHRDRSVRWGPRTVDLDILDFGGVSMRSETLTLPHPRMGERAFVLVPLVEIAPQLILDGVTIVERLKTLDTTGIERRPTEPDWWRTA
ncbi:2-amino-4-hydroxy-6-hydroxymethyldihydropteridine diphosphokinase [Aureimonas phyllosphaerae]|uniref:2-amino-4-hydroxy-6-hydroxymethyldihydropteridine pyrophosphokinase n=1 Tax=Aureimonas phyllosphaerae TaxID=1166078 RepID=A0A7W6BSH4_9HYPH|nr:2-amino-4-hydroxy-6-hydroxymethyldihydropteridine diphosphokinase [Aureimonas phyllosphaerae]MBB3935214.1 2-amino-4-hydroxy-6-hydroxymethyldihydropteridine diphosphokinase [Aureimonas phyllosphaerae]MBB3959222.1 2-amino-4-hydroxy-6-hydroxymethyldihydropteridine diphosphokinase [Aureimonas phyllosphaerae]SFF06289.1 2-amino-4-hydroxy-6-hydroxymethyldihydropteridinediphosphokinase [Aureimonas phyllosphaerae]